MSTTEYTAFVDKLEDRLQTLQKEYLDNNNSNAQLVGPLIAIIMLVKDEKIGFARERFTSIAKGVSWKIADDYILSLKSDVESVLRGPVVFQGRQYG